MTKLDLILNSVIAKRHEVTIDTQGYSGDQVQRILDAATARNLHAAFDGRFVLIRDLKVQV